MAAAILKLFVLSMCLNTFLYLGVNYAMESSVPLEDRPDLQGDLFDLMLSDRNKTNAAIDLYARNLNNTNASITGYKFDLTGNISNPPNEIAGTSVEPERGAFLFLDSLKIVYAFAVTMWRIALMPISLFNYNIFPPLVTLIIAFPLLILNIVTVIVFIRGGGAT